MTLVFSPTAQFSGVAAEGKALQVIKGNDTTVTGLDCSEIGVASGNGACIPQDGLISPWAVSSFTIPSRTSWVAAMVARS